MVISWIFVISLAIESTWTKIIPIQLNTNNHVEKRMDDNVSSYPEWQPSHLDSQTALKQPQLITIDEEAKNEFSVSETNVPQLEFPRAQGLQSQQLLAGHIPQNVDILKTSAVNLPQKLEVSVKDPPNSVLLENPPQSQALQGLPYLKPAQLYQLQPRLLTQNRLSYYQTQNSVIPHNINPGYYQNSGDRIQIQHPYGYEQLTVPSRTLTAPKETTWNPANHPALFYSQDINNQTQDDNKLIATVRTIPKHYKFEKNHVDFNKPKLNSKNKNKIHKVNAKESSGKIKSTSKNNIKESSNQISVEKPKGSASSVRNNNDWVPVARTVPKHYTFEKNSLDNKLKPKNKKKLKGEPVKKVTKPKNYIFEEGTLVKKFKQNKYLQEEPLDEDEWNDSSKKKIKPVQEILEPEIESDTNEKQIEAFEDYNPEHRNKKKETNKATRPKDQINSESYLNNQKNENFHRENGFNHDSSSAPTHGAAPPAGKDRTMFHMVGHDGPMSYKWGFDTGAGKQRQYRFEERDKEGLVKGQFGYLDDKGKFRKMNYHAHPIHGFSMEPADGTFDDLKQ